VAYFFGHPVHALEFIARKL